MDTTASPEVKHRDKPLNPVMLRELSAKSDAQGIARIVSHYSAMAVVGTLIWVVSSANGIAWALPLFPLQGYFIAFLFMPLHETAHKTAFEKRMLNLVVGHLSAVLIAQPYEYYCLFHWEHHRHTQDPDKDPELVVGPKPVSDTQLAIAYSGLQHLAYRLRLTLRHAFTGKVVVPWVPAGRRNLVVREARLHVAAYALLLLVSLALHTAILLWVWVIPLLVGQMILRPYLYSEHTGCERTRSAFENTRTTYTGMVMRWFAWNMPYHVEHHAYPSVPFHALPKLNRIVADQIVFRGNSYRAVIRETWAWFRRVRSRPA